MSEWLADVQEKLNSEFPKCVGLGKTFLFQRANEDAGAGRSGEIRRMQDIAANTEHVAVIAEALGAEISHVPEMVEAAVQDNSTRVEYSNAYISRNKNDNSAIVFSKTVYLFVGLVVDDDETVRDLFAARGMKVVFRDARYWKEFMELKRPDVFVCHDSRDKDRFVEPLVVQLGRRLLKVWYDAGSLKVGDSLTEKIDQGLRECRFGIVVLSPAFIERRPWTAKEFRSLTTKELAAGSNVILPIWLDVSAEDVRKYSLDLADKVALDAKLGAEKIAKRISEVVRASDPRQP